MFRLFLRRIATERVSPMDPKSVSFTSLQLNNKNPFSRKSREKPMIRYSSPYASSFPPSVKIPSQPMQKRPYERIIAIRKLVKLSAKGKHMRFDAWCLAGDRNGSVGIGHSSSTQAAKATQLAMRIARKNMKHYDLFEGRTLHHDIEFDFHGLRLRLLPKHSGYSVRAQRDIYEFCMALGIQDLAAKVMVGSTNPVTITKAMLHSLTYLHKSPEFLAKIRGTQAQDILYEAEHA